MKVHYFLGSGVIGTSSIPAHIYAPDSIAFFCSKCGEIWARALVESQEESWLIENTPCVRHKPRGVPDWGKVPGSLVQGRLRRAEVGAMFAAVTLDSLPSALQNREVALLIRSKEASVA